jgi:DNA-binding protein YbaB
LPWHFPTKKEAEYYAKHLRKQKGRGTVKVTKKGKHDYKVSGKGA